MDIRIYLTLMAVIFLCYAFGYMMGFAKAHREKKKRNNTAPSYAYCMECEITMPVKEKDGYLFCSNCGLSH